MAGAPTRGRRLAALAAGALLAGCASPHDFPGYPVVPAKGKGSLLLSAAPELADKWGRYQADSIAVLGISVRAKVETWKSPSGEPALVIRPTALPDAGEVSRFRLRALSIVSDRGEPVPVRSLAHDGSLEVARMPVPEGADPRTDSEYLIPILLPNGRHYVSSLDLDSFGPAAQAKRRYLRASVTVGPEISFLTTAERATYVGRIIVEWVDGELVAHLERDPERDIPLLRERYPGIFQ